MRSHFSFKTTVGAHRNGKKKQFRPDPPQKVCRRNCECMGWQIDKTQNKHDLILVITIIIIVILRHR